MHTRSSNCARIGALFALGLALAGVGCRGTSTGPATPPRAAVPPPMPDETTSSATASGRSDGAPLTNNTGNQHASPPKGADPTSPPPPAAGTSSPTPGTQTSPYKPGSGNHPSEIGGGPQEKPPSQTGGAVIGDENEGNAGPIKGGDGSNPKQ